MIAITLNFKSIEAARAALLEIPTDALVAEGTPAPKEKSRSQAPAAAASPATAPKVDAPATKASSPESTTTSSAAASGAGEGNAAAAPSAPEAPAAQPASSIDYATLQKAVFSLAGKSRDAAASVAADFGVKTFKELDASKWAEALEAVKAKLAELEAA